MYLRWLVFFSFHESWPSNVSHYKAYAVNDYQLANRAKCYKFSLWQYEEKWAKAREWTSLKGRLGMHNATTKPFVYGLLHKCTFWLVAYICFMCENTQHRSSTMILHKYICQVYVFFFSSPSTSFKLLSIPAFGFYIIFIHLICFILCVTE